MRLLSGHFFVISLAAGGPALITRTEAWPITIQSIQSTHKQNSRFKQGNEHSEKFTSPEMPIHNEMVYKHQTFIPTSMKLENNLVTACRTLFIVNHL